MTMLTKIISGLVLLAVIATGAVSFVASTSDTAEARGFNCRLNPARCDNQIKTPKTFKN